MNWIWVNVLADSAIKALSSITNKMIKNRGFPYSVYSMLYDACVCSVAFYGSEVFGYKECDSQFKLHLKAARIFMGLPKFVTPSGLVSELNWLLPHFRTRIKMVQFFSRLLCTNSSRLTYKIFKWDCQINERYCSCKEGRSR